MEGSWCRGGLTSCEGWLEGPILNLSCCLETAALSFHRVHCFVVAFGEEVKTAAMEVHFEGVTKIT